MRGTFYERHFNSHTNLKKASEQNLRKSSLLLILRLWGCYTAAMLNSQSLEHQCVSCAGVQLNLALGVITNSAGETQRLSPINLKLLVCLLQQQGEVISRADLFATIWPNQIISDDVLTRAVSDIRTQLARLDADARFIETLPKRGYRWALTVHPVVAAAAQATPAVIDPVAIDPVAIDPVVIATTSVVGHASRAYLLPLLGYAVAAILVAVIFMAWLSRGVMQPSLRLALLPTVSEHRLAEPLAQALDEELAQQLRKNPRIKLVSKTAIAARPANPFPYFFNEFGALWVLESRVSNYEGGDNIELSLVDARTGLEVRSVHFEAAGSAGLATVLAKKLELLQELP